MSMGQREYEESPTHKLLLMALTFYSLHFEAELDFKEIIYENKNSLSDSEKS